MHCHCATAPDFSPICGISRCLQPDLAAQSALTTVTDVTTISIAAIMLKSVHHWQVVDEGGKEHEVLLRSFVHGHQETMYLLDRLATLLHAANAQPGDMLMLSRDENGPVVNLLSLSRLSSNLLVVSITTVLQTRTTA